jgi:hypothetical protein
MQEGDARVVGTFAGSLIDQSEIGGPQSGEAGVDVVDGVCDVVEALAAFVDERGDGGIRRGRLEKFDADLMTGRSQAVEGDADVLARDFLYVLKGCTEHGLVEVPMRFEGLDCNSDVID